MKSKSIDLSGLDQFKASDLLSPISRQPGKLMQVDINKIHEDHENSRQEFDETKLQELVESITAVNPVTNKPRGIKNPLSLKPHPEIQGEFIINAGHRRLKAAMIANLTEVPAFIDDDADDYDNTVDNIQREGLTPLEIAHFIKKRLDAGDKKSDIAKQLGKSATFVSHHLTFFDMVDCIRDLYDSGYCRSMQALALLHRTYKKFPGEIEAFCTEINDEVSITKVQVFCNGLKTQNLSQEPQIDEKPSEVNQVSEHVMDDISSVDHDDSTAEVDNTKQSMATLTEDDALEKSHHVTLHVQHSDKKAILLIDKPSTYGFGWIKYADDSHEQASR